MEIALKSLWPSIDRSWKSMRATCDNPVCHNTHLMRTIPGGRTGIQAGDRWYCSVDCFARGSGPLLSELAQSRFAENQREPRMSLGLILVSKGLLSADQLRFAQSSAEMNHDSLESTLLRHQLVNERQLAAARAAQWGYPLLKDRVGSPVELNIPIVLLREFSAVPFEVSTKARRILIGFVFRVEHSLLESIEKTTGFQVVPCFTTATQYAQQLGYLTTGRNYDDVLIPEPGSVERMARTLGQCALDVGATEAIFSHCKNFVWSRITGSKGIFDVLFRFDGAIDPEQSSRLVHAQD